MESQVGALKACEMECDNREEARRTGESQASLDRCLALHEVSSTNTVLDDHEEPSQVLLPGAAALMTRRSPPDYPPPPPPVPQQSVEGVMDATQDAARTAATKTEEEEARGAAYPSWRYGST